MCPEYAVVVAVAVAPLTGELEFSEGSRQRRSDKDVDENPREGDILDRMDVELIDKVEKA